MPYDRSELHNCSRVGSSFLFPSFLDFKKKAEENVRSRQRNHLPMLTFPNVIIQAKCQLLR